MYGPCQADGCDRQATHIVHPNPGPHWYGCEEHSAYAAGAGAERQILDPDAGR